ncbi:hypothetical protein D3C86_1010960 [compost metagenome]
MACDLRRLLLGCLHLIGDDLLEAILDLELAVHRLRFLGDLRQAGGVGDLGERLDGALGLLDGRYPLAHRLGLVVGDRHLLGADLAGVGHDVRLVLGRPLLGRLGILRRGFEELVPVSGLLRGLGRRLFGLALGDGPRLFGGRRGRSGLLGLAGDGDLVAGIDEPASAHAALAGGVLAVLEQVGIRLFDLVEGDAVGAGDLAQGVAGLDRHRLGRRAAGLRLGGIAGGHAGIEGLALVRRHRGEDLVLLGLGHVGPLIGRDRRVTVGPQQLARRGHARQLRGATGVRLFAVAEVQVALAVRAAPSLAGIQRRVRAIAVGGLEAALQLLQALLVGRTLRIVLGNVGDRLFRLGERLLVHLLCLRDGGLVALHERLLVRLLDGGPVQDPLGLVVELMHGDALDQGIELGQVDLAGAILVSLVEDLLEGRLLLDLLVGVQVLGLLQLLIDEVALGDRLVFRLRLLGGDHLDGRLVREIDREFLTDARRHGEHLRDSK